MALELIAGRYRVERSVGEGSMGKVWLCRDEVLHRAVAVKQIGVMPGDTADSARRAMREARTLAALSHENAVSIYDVVEHDGAPWLVMEYVPSQTLAELMADGPLPADRVARIGAQVAAALAAAHGLGIIHRDVKPGNILVGGNDLAKISDFGIARLAHDDQLTATGLMTGTPAYFSPELARGGDPAPESDVWALGASLYAAVEGAPPFPRSTNAIATLHAIVSDPVPRPALAGALADPIGHMMDRDPATRWTMARCETALRGLAERGPVDDEATSLLAPPALAVGSAAGSTAAQTGSEPASGRRFPVLLVALAVAALILLGVGGYLAGIALSGDTSQTQGPGAGDSTPAADRTPGQSPSRKPTGSPSRTPTRSPSQEPSGSPRGEPTGSPPGSGATPPELTEAEFLEEYFDTVPDDTDTGWSLLSTTMQQSGTREGYESFWASNDDVEISNIRPSGGGVVLAHLTRTTDDGTVFEEEQRFTLVRNGSGYLIESDELISSRTVSD